MDGKAVERTGLVPRSIIRTFSRFLQQLEPDAKAQAVQEFRISRYQVLVSVKSLIILFLVPIIVNISSKAFLFEPLVRYIWNSKQHDIFLNSYQENRAFLEMEDFSERMFFESLIQKDAENIPSINHYSASKVFKTIKNWIADFFQAEIKKTKNHSNNSPLVVSQVNSEKQTVATPSNVMFSQGQKNMQNFSWFDPFASSNPEDAQSLYINERFGAPSSFAKGASQELRFNRPFVDKERDKVTHSDGEYSLEERTIDLDFQREVLQIVNFYNNESIQSICNILGESLTLLTIAFLLSSMKTQMIILKSFLTESFYSLNDTTKSFLIILITDLLVGFHSPRGWEISLETILKHFGLPENQDFIFLFVATFPVFLDTIFKYWVFRYLNKISPSTVATYHNMIE